MSTASSVSAWLISPHCHFGSEPSGPGTPRFMICVRPRQEFSRSSSTSIVELGEPLADHRVLVGAALARELLELLERDPAPRRPTTAPRPARSFISVVIATAQPLPTPPTTFSSGIRASSMKSSLNSGSFVIW